VIPLLRPARPRDAAALGAIMADWVEATPWVPAIHSRAAYRDFARQMIDTMTVSVAGRLRRRGFLARRGGFVHALYLAPGWCGRGLGRRLLAAAKAAEPRLTLWAFVANAPARAFYAREGFVEVEMGDGSGNDAGLPEVRLEWRRQA